MKKSPDGLNLIPWPDERCVTWDVTVADTVAASYTTSCAGSAAEAAATRKDGKYSDISGNYRLFPLGKKMCQKDCIGLSTRI